MAGRAAPEHSQQKCCEQRRVHERENQLQQSMMLLNCCARYAVATESAMPPTVVQRPTVR
jgi:hypothetical protein